MQIVMTEAPRTEPVTLLEAKDQLRVLHTAEDGLIARLSRVARTAVEGMLSRALIDQGMRLELPEFPGHSVIRLARPPVLSVTSVRYLDSGGTLRTLDPSTYVVTLDALTPRVALADGASWPATAAHPAAVVIDYRAGFGAAVTDVPEDIRHAILLLVEHHYANRGATSEGSRSVVPMSVDALLAPWRTSGWI